MKNLNLVQLLMIEGIRMQRSLVSMAIIDCLNIWSSSSSLLFFIVSVSLLLSYLFSFSPSSLLLPYCPLSSFFVFSLHFSVLVFLLFSVYSTSSSSSSPSPPPPPPLLLVFFYPDTVFFLIFLTNNCHVVLCIFFFTSFMDFLALFLIHLRFNISVLTSFATNAPTAVTRFTAKAQHFS